MATLSSVSTACGRIAAVLIVSLTVLCSSDAQVWNSEISGNQLASLRGQVLTPTGQAVSGVRVELRAITGGVVSNAWTAKTGDFEFHNIVPNMYQIVATQGTDVTDTTVQIDSLSLEVTLHLGTAAVEKRSPSSVDISELEVPRKAKNLYEKATESLNKNKLDAATKEVESALEVCPRFAAALTLRGLLKMRSNRHEEAQKDFASAIESDRGYALAYVALAANYNLMRKFDDALNVIEASKAHTAQPWQAYYETSKAYVGKHLFLRALQEANQASALAGREVPGLNLIKAEAYLQLQQTDPAKKQLYEYLAQVGKGPQADKVRQLLASMGN